MRSLTAVAGPVEPAYPHGTTPALTLTEPGKVVTFDCTGCDDTVTTVPVKDPVAVYMLGADAAQPWCSQECLDAAAERAWSQP